MSSRSLDDLHGEIRPLVNDFLSQCVMAGLDVLVTCTLRSNEEQAVLYAKGRTTEPIGRKYVVTDALPGQSAHNYGLAIDIVPMIAGKPDWNGEDPVWQRVGEIGVSAGLEWAGTPGFPFPEKPHFQLADWRKVAGL